MGAKNATIPPPFNFSPSQLWDGNDGRWSTFDIRVGEPPQDFRVLPSTVTNDIWVPLSLGCQEPGDPSDCADRRGVYAFHGRESQGFQTNSSSTYSEIGIYDLLHENELRNYTGNGLFFLDTVGLQVQNSGGLELNRTVVAGFKTKNYFLGVFGLGSKASNFSNFDDPQPSFMTTLRNRNMIPSLSYGYTAGAFYRTPKSYGSLTLGGFDRSRIVTPDQKESSFQFSENDSRILSVTVQSISAINTLRGAASLMSTSIISVIDSTVPQLWLPQIVCDAFEAAFGLSYDPISDLYLVNDTTHDSLLASGAAVEIKIGAGGDPSKWISIELPYSAFDLQASYPIFVNATKNYFPIRRAANDSEYTLGRAFLQEAYIVVDYERSNFSIYQARFNQQIDAPDIVPIPPPSSSSKNESAGGMHQLSASAIVGIVAGVGVALLILVIAIWLIIRLRKVKRTILEPGMEKKTCYVGVEIMGEQRVELQQPSDELQGSKVETELHHHPVICELPASKVP